MSRPTGAPHHPMLAAAVALVVASALTACRSGSGPSPTEPAVSTRVFTGDCAVDELHLPDGVQADQGGQVTDMDPTGRYISGMATGPDRQLVPILWDNGVPRVLDVCLVELRHRPGGPER